MQHYEMYITVRGISEGQNEGVSTEGRFKLSRNALRVN